MLSTPARLILAAAVAAGGAMVVPASASAAAPCLVGKWRITKYKLNAKADGMTLASKGGVGTKLTITKKTVKFDFASSKRVTTKMKGEGMTYQAAESFKKTLAFKSTLKGKKKGALLLKPKSASGPATVSSYMGGKFMDKANLAKQYRKGDGNLFIPLALEYTCAGKTAKLQLKEAGQLSYEFTYKRR